MMNNYNKNKNHEIIMLTMKFKKYNNQHLYKWETNYQIYSYNSKNIFIFVDLNN